MIGRGFDQREAHVGLRGVFYKDGPSYEELLLQLQWATSMVEAHFLLPSAPTAAPPTPKLWDLTGFPEWACLEKVGPNAYKPTSRGALAGSAATASAGAAAGGGGPAGMELDEEAQLQLALAASLAQQ